MWTEFITRHQNYLFQETISEETEDEARRDPVEDTKEEHSTQVVVKESQHALPAQLSKLRITFRGLTFSTNWENVQH